jgi:hypothetical protein
MDRTAQALLVVAGCALAVATAGDGRAERSYVCAFDQLAFKRQEISAPQQTQAVAIAVYNTRSACRLRLPVSLRLVHIDGRPLRVAGGTSRLTLKAARIEKGAKASAAWTYTNYCGGDSARPGPKVTVIFRIDDVELRTNSGGAPCNAPGDPIVLRLLFACPSATGPAVNAVRAQPPCRR